MRAAAVVMAGLVSATAARADERIDVGDDAVRLDAPAATLTLAFVGDVMFGRYVPGGFAAIAAEAQDPFVEVAPLLVAADLAFANLETPVMARPPATSPWGTRMRFVTTPARLATLAAAGVDVVSLANNHHYDLRARGVAETPRHVEAAGLIAVGRARVTAPVRAETLERAGWRVAVIAFSTVRNGEQRAGQPLLPFVEERAIARRVAPVVAAARATHALVIVVPHWGREYAAAPSTTIVRAAHALVDAGADLVIGSHPHVLQPIERYRDAVIAYSLGDFLFDHTRVDRRLAGVLTLAFARGAGAPCLAGARFTPTVHVATPTQHPALATGADADAVRARVVGLSAATPFATPWTDDGTGALVTAPACPP